MVRLATRPHHLRQARLPRQRREFPRAPLRDLRRDGALRRLRAAAGRQAPGAGFYYLTGLTSTEETLVIKGGAQRLAAKHGPILVVPDKSPRGLGPPRGREPNGSRTTDQTVTN